MTSLLLSRECLDALHAVVMQRCPCALEDREFLPLLMCAVEEEVVRVIETERAAAREACWRWIRKAGAPCNN